MHLYQQKFIEFINENPEKYPAITKIYYFTDGSAAQYKNKKNFMNISQHLKDFHLPAEWNFFATAHGKGPSDGVGGTLKREARRASLRGINIDTAESLYKWAKEWSSQNDRVMKFCYVTATDVEEHETLLFERFRNVKTISGTQGFHCIKASTESDRIIAMEYSFSTDSKCLTLKKIFSRK